MKKIYFILIIIFLIALGLSFRYKSINNGTEKSEIVSQEEEATDKNISATKEEKSTISEINEAGEESEDQALSWYKPTPGLSWQWQLSGKINTSYNVDLYDIDLEETPQATIDELHKRGIKVICYFSAGSWEEYRSDAKDFPKDVIGKTMDDWPDEKWLDISNYEKFSGIIRGRLDLAVEKNCDGVEADNMDSYQNNNGLSLTYGDQLRYNKWLAEEAHSRSLSIALKNDLEQVKDLVNHFDFAINEQCFEYDECGLLLPFIKQNKAVFGTEYELSPSSFCKEANRMNFSWLKMKYDLDGGRISCR
ncbi:hypothetical protein BMS3Abin15_00640 [bacterium BMS3Abin15]|nr:hypothetical protein BMS3Abin15_00640 [bacterium BMS3Abin15]HDZ85793.1 endo alpha-1,4 polygalactosaminidase [Candidatus Moranbacteria bacterium]